MERLTTDHPKENFGTMLNYVFSKERWAYIRSDGESEEPVPLTEWARKQCAVQGCEDLPTDPEEIDQYIADCAYCAPACPVFLAYTFAVQGCHLRDRLKQIEDILGDDYDLDHLRELVEAEKAGRLVVLPCKVGTPVWVTSAFFYRCDPPKEGRVTKFVLHDDAIVYCEALVLMDLGSGNKEYGFSTDSFGKIVFLTYEEAEAALEKEKGGGEG